MMKKLLIEEMKRAIAIMESKEELTKEITELRQFGIQKYPITFYDRDITELKQLLLAIRKHSILLEKGIK
jgi:hypothetical protein